jgi:hypothetical protein
LRASLLTNRHHGMYTEMHLPLRLLLLLLLLYSL